MYAYNRGRVLVRPGLAAPFRGGFCGGWNSCRLRYGLSIPLMWARCRLCSCRSDRKAPGQAVSGWPVKAINSAQPLPRETLASALLLYRRYWHLSDWFSQATYKLNTTTHLSRTISPPLLCCLETTGWEDEPNEEIRRR